MHSKAAEGMRRYISGLFKGTSPTGYLRKQGLNDEQIKAGLATARWLRHAAKLARSLKPEGKIGVGIIKIGDVRNSQLIKNPFENTPGLTIFEEKQRSVLSIQHDEGEAENYSGLLPIMNHYAEKIAAKWKVNHRIQREGNRIDFIFEGRE